MGQWEGVSLSVIETILGLQLCGRFPSLHLYLCIGSPLWVRCYYRGVLLAGLVEKRLCGVMERLWPGRELALLALWVMELVLTGSESLGKQGV